jgi:hypothetical protein
VYVALDGHEFLMEGAINSNVTMVRACLEIKKENIKIALRKQIEDGSAQWFCY